MSGEKELSRLLAGLSPSLGEEVYVFATVPSGTATKELFPVMQFTEEEGVTLILKKQTADTAGLAGEFPCRKIILKVHSALAAAGLMAAVSSALAEKGIPVNPVAGFYHDHLFVPVERAEEAVVILQALHTTSSYA